MLRKPPPALDAGHVFAEPTPLGLIGLALGCAALVPLAFGADPSPSVYATAGMFCLLFGAGCQMLAGLMSFANKNLYGGTLFTAFAFYWMINWWALGAWTDNMLAQQVIAAGGTATPVALPDPTTLLAVDVTSLVVFLVLTYGFCHYSKMLFVFLADIDLMFVLKVIDGFRGTHDLALGVAILTVGLGAIALWIAFALLINPVAGRNVFPVTGPVFKATPPAPGFDFSLRHAIFDALYRHFKEQAFAPMPLATLRAALPGDADPLPDLFYLQERGGLLLSPDGGDEVEGVRLTAAGIDLYEERVLGK